VKLLKQTLIPPLTVCCAHAVELSSPCLRLCASIRTPAPDIHVLLLEQRLHLFLLLPCTGGGGGGRFLRAGGHGSRDGAVANSGLQLPLHDDEIKVTWPAGLCAHIYINMDFHCWNFCFIISTSAWRGRYGLRDGGWHGILVEGGEGIAGSATEGGAGPWRGRHEIHGEGGTGSATEGGAGSRRRAVVPAAGAAPKLPRRCHPAPR
jgi:hypothetical protein